jgi:hypothetical protein
MQKFITLHNNDCNDILAPIIPRRIRIGESEYSTLKIHDIYGDRVLIHAAIAGDKTYSPVYYDNTTLLEYNTTTSSAVILTGRNEDYVNHAMYAAENILVVMTYDYQDHVVRRVFINIVDGSKCAVVDSV